jgi:hypothetical protein
MPSSGEPRVRRSYFGVGKGRVGATIPIEGSRKAKSGGVETLASDHLICPIGVSRFENLKKQQGRS